MYKEKIDTMTKISLAKLLYSCNNNEIKDYFKSMKNIFLSNDFVNSLVKYINDLYQG